MSRSRRSLLRWILPLVALAAATACPGGSQRGSRVPAGEQESLETILTHARSAYRDGDFGEAQKAFEQALAADPSRTDLVATLATCYLKNRVTNKAEELLTKHLAQHPDDTAALLVLGRVYIRKGQLDDAAKALRSVLDSDPDNLLAHYNLGFIDYRRRRYEEAERHLRRTLELRPEHPEASYTLGLVYLAQNRLDDAIAALQRAIAIDPRHVGAHFNLANALARAGRMKEAEEQQRIYADLSGQGKAAEEVETQIKTSSIKAVRLMLEEKYPEALAEYQQIATRFPDNATLRTRIGMLQLRLGQRDAALQTLRKAVELDPRQGDAHYLLSGLYRETGDEAAAERELRIFATLETIPEGKSGY
ncbi:MAG TPA: tetratricopeptide repeat protein [Candidatus Polarisedimenticolia bacterium]|nr:tetratricopeptide repeat protein [Candidatus Polarisedimenticolia bacterium]